MPAAPAALTLVTSTWEVHAWPRVVGCAALSSQFGPGGLGPGPSFVLLSPCLLKALVVGTSYILIDLDLDVFPHVRAW